MPAWEWLWARASEGERGQGDETGEDRTVHGSHPEYVNYCLGGMVMPSILDMSWPAIGSAGAGVGVGAGVGTGRAGRGAEALGDGVGPGVATGGIGAGSGTVAGAVSTGAAAGASAAGWASTGFGSAAG